MLFQDRKDAGRVLAGLLASLRDINDAVALALPRGGVPVAFEVARELGLPLDIFIVRKLGVPGHEELAMGAIASGGTKVLNQNIIEQLGISNEAIDRVAAHEKTEIDRRERFYRAGHTATSIEGRSVILIDDGLATGASMRAAARALKSRARKVIVAVPVAAKETCDEFRDEVDAVICATTPEPFIAVGMWYRNFEQTGDEEVRSLLAQAADRKETAHPRLPRTA